MTKRTDKKIVLTGTQVASCEVDERTDQVGSGSVGESAAHATVPSFSKHSRRITEQETLVVKSEGEQWTIAEGPADFLSFRLSIARGFSHNSPPIDKRISA